MGIGFFKKFFIIVVLLKIYNVYKRYINFFFLEKRFLLWFLFCVVIMFTKDQLLLIRDCIIYYLDEYNYFDSDETIKDLEDILNILANNRKVKGVF